MDLEDALSAEFSGTSVLLEPKASWVARWSATASLLPGVYALAVEGELSTHLQARVAGHRGEYVPRVGVRRT